METTESARIRKLPPFLRLKPRLQSLGGSLRQTARGLGSYVQSKIDAFLNLRGRLADDKGFDRAMTLMEKAWQTWTAALAPIPPSRAAHRRTPGQSTPG